MSDELPRADRRIQALYARVRGLAERDAVLEKRIAEVEARSSRRMR